MDINSSFLSLSINDSTKRVIETVTFNPYNFVSGYDKSVFSEKSKFKLVVGDKYCNITLLSNSDNAINHLAILKLKDPQTNNTMYMLVDKKQITALVSHSNFTPKQMNQILMQLQQTSQKEGMKAREYMARISDKIESLKKEILVCEKSQLKELAAKKGDEAALTYVNKSWDVEDFIRQSGLSQAQAQLIKNKSAGIWDLLTFLKKHPSISENTTVIGHNRKNIIQALSQTLNCEYYMDFYLRVFKSPIARADFMEKLTDQNTPIIFLVPRHLLGGVKHREGITAGEMRWLLDHPEKLPLVHFVFAAYKAYSQVPLRSLNLSDKQLDFLKDEVSVRVFKQIEAEGKLPEEKLFDFKKLVQLRTELNQALAEIPVPYQKPSKPIIEEVD
jgi:hypothetical protein